jgi:hypothetical protein
MTEEAVVSVVLSTVAIVASIVGLSATTQTNIKEIVLAVVPSLMAGGTAVRLGRQKWLAPHLFVDDDNDPATPPVVAGWAIALVGVLVAMVVGLSIALGLALT